MAEDGFLSIGFIPNFDELEEMMENEELEKEVTLTSEEDGLGDAATDMSGDAQTGSGGGGGLAGAAEPLMAMSGSLAKLVSIAAVLLMLEPIQQTLGLIMRILEISILPVMILLITILRPFIQSFMRLIPPLMEFARNPTQGLKGIIDMMLGNLQTLLQEVLDFPTASDIGQVIGDRLDVLNPFTSSDDGGTPSPFSRSPLLNSLGGNAQTTSNQTRGTVTQPSTQGQPTTPSNQQDQAGILDEAIDFGSNLFADMSDEAKKEQTLQLFGSDVGDVYGGGLFG